MAEIITLLALFFIALPKMKISINNPNSLTADFSTNVKGFLCILIFIITWRAGLKIKA